MAIIRPELISEKDRAIIEERAVNDASPRDFFIRKLSEGVGSIAAAFYPNPVIVRLGDFKSNEYCRLIGGEVFEPHEENPMIGLRGASRYLHKDFADAFKLECEALEYVRKTMKLDNVHIMVPFCRTRKYKYFGLRLTDFKLGCALHKKLNNNDGVITLVFNLTLYSSLRTKQPRKEGVSSKLSPTMVWSKEKGGRGG